MFNKEFDVAKLKELVREMALILDHLMTYNDFGPETENKIADIIHNKRVKKIMEEKP